MRSSRGGIEAVAALGLAGGRARRQHFGEPRARVWSTSSCFRRRARGPHGGQDAAAGRRDLRVRRAAEPPPQFVATIAGKHDVRVAVDEAGHQRMAAAIDHTVARRPTSARTSAVVPAATIVAPSHATAPSATARCRPDAPRARRGAATVQSASRCSMSSVITGGSSRSEVRGQRSEVRGQGVRTRRRTRARDSGLVDPVISTRLVARRRAVTIRTACRGDPADASTATTASFAASSTGGGDADEQSSAADTLDGRARRRGDASSGRERDARDRAADSSAGP